MSENKTGVTSRRQFMTNTSRTMGASALAGVALPHVHAAENNTIQMALVGCGGRGTGAAINALSVKNGPTKLVAMADVVPKKLSDSYDKLKSQFAGQVDVPPERRFLGFDAYRQAMDSMKAGDVVILGTPPAFRWVQFSYAIDKGLHTFMEKPVTVDGPTTRRMLKLGELSVQKNLKVGVGLMVRHCGARQELLNRIRSGQIGEIVAMRAYRMGQQNPVDVYILVTEDTLEERLLATLAAKQDLALAALDSESEVDQVYLASGMEELKRRLEVLLGPRAEAHLEQSLGQTERSETGQFTPTPLVTTQDSPHSPETRNGTSSHDPANAGGFAFGNQRASPEDAARRERVSVAGGQLLAAAVALLSELLPSRPETEASRQLAETLKQGFADCLHRNQYGQTQLTFTLPDPSVLNHLADSLAKRLTR